MDSPVDLPLGKFTENGGLHKGKNVLLLQMKMVLMSLKRRMKRLISTLMRDS